MAWALALLAACAPPPTASTTPDPTAARPPARTATLVARIGEGETVAVIGVNGTLAGRRTRFVVDSGSTSHLLAGWLVRRLGLPTRASGVARIGSDAVARSAQQVEHAAMAVDGLGALPDAPVDVVDMPAEFEQFGYGGVLAPMQLLDGDARVVLDLSERTLTVTSADDAARRLAAQPVAVAPALFTACHPPGLAGAPLVIASASIGGHAARLIVDTGSTRTTVMTDGALWPRLHATAEDASGDPSTSISATRATAGIARQLPVRVGTVERRVDLDVLTRAVPMCPNDGMLGLDVLSDCVLVFARDAFAMGCAP